MRKKDNKVKEKYVTATENNCRKKPLQPQSNSKGYNRLLLEN